MIHTVSPPEPDFEWLKEILELQLAVLGIASSLAAPLSADGVELHDGLDQIPAYQAHADSIARWICNKKEALFIKLQVYASHTDTDAKVELWCEIADDHRLLLSPREETLQARFGKESDEETWKYAVGRFLYEWYDLWSKRGLDYYLFKTRTKEQDKYKRQDFVTSFIEVNRHLYCCAICDAGAYRNETTSGVYTSIDHYFPRAQYPHLALHPFNLLPMCPACNSGEAGQRDPGASIMALTDLVLPYHDKGIGQGTYVKVEFRPVSGETERDPDEDYSRKISIVPAQAVEGVEPMSEARLKQFEAVYGIGKRWNKQRNLTLIDEHVFRRMRQFLLTDVHRGEVLSDPEFLRDRLELLMALVEEESVGRDPFSFVTVWWLMWQIKRLENQKPIDVEIEDCDELYKQLATNGAEPLLSELSYWACEQQKGFKLLRRRITELQAMMPATVQNASTK